MKAKKEAPVLSPREAKLIAQWQRTGRTAPTLDDVRARVGAKAAARVASALVAKGALLRVGAGRYLLPVEPEEPHDRSLLAVSALLADEPHYIGGDWALFLHEWSDSPPDTPVDVFVTSRRPSRVMEGAQVRFHAIGAEAFAYGLTHVDVEGTKVRVSDLERTVLDYVDHAQLFGGLDEEVAFVREFLSLFDADQLVKHAARGSTDATRRRLGAMLERQQSGARHRSQLLRSIQTGSSIISLFPGRPRRGPINQSFLVIENAPELQRPRWRRARGS